MSLAFTGNGQPRTPGEKAKWQTQKNLPEN
jgi:hypothetical protein